MRATRHRGRAHVVAVAVVAAVSLAIGCGKTAEEAPPPPPPEVVAAAVVQQDVPIYAEWVGTVDGNINAQIRPRVQGYLQTRTYQEGARVRTNDLLFEIDARPYKAAFDQAKGDLARAEASLTKAEQDVRRYTPLAKEGAVSQMELDNAVQAARAGRAQVASATATVENAQLDLDWTQVRSPIDGVAGISTAQIGDLVSEQTVLTTVSQIDPVRVSFPISEQEYLRYAERLRLIEGSSRRQGTLELIRADGSVHPQRGTATVVNREVDIKTGTMTVIGLFPNPDHLLRPGQYAKVRAETETRKAALMVPQRAVQEAQGVFRVAVVGADDKISMRTVKAGPRVGNLWVIDEGLKPGERVVVEGLQKVRDGVTVVARASESPGKE